MTTPRLPKSPRFGSLGAVPARQTTHYEQKTGTLPLGLPQVSLTHFPEVVYEMFRGTPRVRDDYMYPNDKPGLGVHIDEKLAARYPCRDRVELWTQPRLPDGSPARP